AWRRMSAALAANRRLCCGRRLRAFRRRPYAGSVRRGPAILVIGLSVALAVAVGPAAPGPARNGGLITQTDPSGDVAAAGLSKAERDAVDIASVRAVGSE